MSHATLLSHHLQGEANNQKKRCLSRKHQPRIRATEFIAEEAPTWRGPAKRRMFS